jgi:hypothetical protein
MQNNFISRSLLLLTLLLPTQASMAQQIATEVLDEVDIQRSSFNAIVKILFKQPLRYLSHSPAHQGKTLIIRVNLVSSATRFATSTLENESIKVNSDTGLNEVVFEPSDATNSTILLYFNDSIAYDVIQGSDQRSLSIVIYGLDNQDRP